VPLVFAWYGFVAERLAGRLSPLLVALLVGCAFTLPLVLATRIIDARDGLADFFSSLTSYSAAEGLGILGSIAVAIPGVWLARKARGSLLPTAVLLCATRVGVFVAIWASPTGASYTRIQEVYDAAVIVAAVLVAVGGRMWRRPETTSLPALASPPALHEPSPAPGDYEVVVHHVSWPG